MKTVKEYLQTMDTERLIDEYLYKDPILIEKIKNQDLTIREVIEGQRATLRDYITNLANMDITPPSDGHQGILYVHRCVGMGCNDLEIAFELVFLDEIKTQGTDAQSYAYEFSPQSEIIGFLVSETYLTQYYIYELMVDVLYEASFFGYEQEDLMAAQERLDSAAEEVSKPDFKGIPWEDVKADLEKKMGYKFDEESKGELKKHRKVWEAEIEYNYHSRKKELKKVMEEIEKEGL